jgi:hypothetical protein
MKPEGAANLRGEVDALSNFKPRITSMKQFDPAASFMLLAAVTFALAVLILDAISPRPQAAQSAFLNSWQYQETQETTYQAPAKSLPVTLLHAPGLTSTGASVYPVKVYLNGTLLPAQPTKVWALNGTALVVTLPSVPPVDPITIPATSAFGPAAPSSARVDVDYWYGQ